jgi:hypothetical protein
MITNIISAIGNNRSVYPLILRDCGIEVPSKIYITRKENLKESKTKANDATREKFIDEYATSAVWLGGIPFVEKIYNKFIKNKGFNPNTDIKLFKEEEFQGIKYNINKFKNSAAKEIKDLEKFQNNRLTIEKLTAGKFAAATLIPIALMGFVLPKLNFALTKKIKDKRKINTAEKLQKPTMGEFTSGKNLSFTGNWISTIANLKTVDKMAVTDGGLTVGRVTTSRNKDEACVNAFRMVGSMILNFVTPIYIAKFLDKSANKVFGVNVNLDPLIMGDKNLVAAIKNNNIELPKSDSPKDLFEFIDSKPQSLFSQLASSQGKIVYLKSNFRDPRKYVDTKDLGNFRNQLENFIKTAQKSSDITKFVKKAKFVKGVNILSNVLMSSALLAIALPKLQYGFNKLLTGSYSDPGLR